MSKGVKKLVKRLKKGDQAAFTPFYEKMAPGLLRYLLWKTHGNRPLSEDVLQESFVRFLVNLDRIEKLEDLAIHSYLLRIVKHCFIDKVARAPHARREHVPIESFHHLADGASERQESAVELRELSIAMDSLNERESEIIWLRDGLGLSHREVAQEMGVTEAASRQAYRRAKKNLFTELTEDWIPQKPTAEMDGGTYATPKMS